MASRTRNTLGSTSNDIKHAVTGMITEAGELLDAYKRTFAYGAELDKVNVIEECGDIIWYASFYLDLAGSRIDIDSIKSSSIPSISILDIPIDMVSLATYVYNTPSGHGVKIVKKLISRVKQVLSEVGSSVPECLDKNIKKLEVRYGSRWSQDNALNRNLDKERTILESKGNSVESNADN